VVDNEPKQNLKKRALFTYISLSIYSSLSKLQNTEEERREKKKRDCLLFFASGDDVTLGIMFFFFFSRFCDILL
jgi:hypothetical protein